MTTIFSPISSPTAAPYSNVNNTQNQQVENPQKIVIEVTSGEKNVTSGDRSNNTAQISITTPNRESEFEISREHAFNALEIRAQKKILNQAIGQPSGNSPLVKRAAIAQSGVVENENLEELAYLKVKKDQVQIAQNVSASNSSGNINEGSSGNSSQTTPPLAQLNEAQDAYMKQQLVFSTIDRLDISQKI